MKLDRSFFIPLFFYFSVLSWSAHGDDSVESQVIALGKSMGYSFETSDQSKDVCVKNNPMIPLLRCGSLLHGRPDLLGDSGAWTTANKVQRPQVTLSQSVLATAGLSKGFAKPKTSESMVQLAVTLGGGLTTDQKSSRQFVLTDAGVAEYLLPKGLAGAASQNLIFQRASQFVGFYDPRSGACLKPVLPQSATDLSISEGRMWGWVIPQTSPLNLGSQAAQFKKEKDLGNSPSSRMLVAESLKKIVDSTQTPVKLSARLIKDTQAVLSQKETCQENRNWAQKANDRILNQISILNESRTSHFLYLDIVSGRVLETPAGVDKAAYLAHYQKGYGYSSPPGNLAPESESTPWSSMSQERQSALDRVDESCLKLYELQNVLAGSVPGIDPDTGVEALAQLQSAAFGALLCGKEIHAAINTTQDPGEKKALTDLRDSLRQLLVRLGVKKQSTPATDGSSGTSGSAGSAGQL
jgi:hypothetical protein